VENGCVTFSVSPGAGAGHSATTRLLLGEDKARDRVPGLSKVAPFVAGEGRRTGFHFARAEMVMDDDSVCGLRGSPRHVNPRVWRDRLANTEKGRNGKGRGGRRPVSRRWITGS